MFKYVVLPAALPALLATPALAYTDDELTSALVGTWGSEKDCPSALLVFNPDGTFVSQVSPGGPEQHGKYTIENGKLSGSTDEGTAMPLVEIVWDGKSMSFKDDAGRTNPLFSCPP
jgi:hypothetical protein